MKKVLSVLGVAALVGGLSSCKLSENSQRAADNSEKAAHNSTDLLELNQTAFGDGRQGGARASRVAALEALDSNESLDMKVMHAGSYFQSLEFQLFKASGFREDNASKLDRLFQVAISDVAKVAAEYTNGVKIASDQSLFSTLGLDGQEVTGTKIDARSFAALALAMSSVSERQNEASVRYNFAKTTFVDVVDLVMTQKNACEASPEAAAKAPVFVYEGIKAKDMLIKLLQMRVNMMAGTALQVLKSPVALVDATDPTKGLKITATAIEIRDATDRLKAAMQAKSILAKGGAESAMFGDVAGGLGLLVQGLGRISPEGIASDSKLPGLMTVKALAEGLL